jgi:ribose transport system substrate-binding protein
MFSKHRHFHARWLLGCTALLATSLLIAGCGTSDDSSSSGSGGASVNPAIPRTGCGSVATPQPNDEDGVLATFPASTREQYAGYATPVRKNFWADFKPNHPPPYKVGLVFAQVSAASQVGIFESLKKNLGNDPDIKLTATSTGGQTNIPQQQQLYTSLLNEKPDLLLVQPLTDAFGPLVDKAGKQGIPTLSFQATTSSDYAINLQTNNYGSGAQGASVVFRQMGGKGNVLYVHGIASATIDQESYSAYQAALKNCPDIKPAGEIAGAFLPATAKAETLKFLATHPGPIEGVVHTGGMTAGIISAFEEAGRPVPIVDDRGGQKGSLGYWTNNQDSYNGFGQGYPPGAYGAAISSVAKRILAGRGLKISDITNQYVPITDENLGQWAQKDWDLKTPGTAEGPPQVFFTEKFLSTLFEDPAPAK